VLHLINHCGFGAGDPGPVELVGSDAGNSATNPFTLTVPVGTLLGDTLFVQATDGAIGGTNTNTWTQDGTVFRTTLTDLTGTITLTANGNQAYALMVLRHVRSAVVRATSASDTLAGFTKGPFCKGLVTTILAEQGDSPAISSQSGGWTSSAIGAGVSLGAARIGVLLDPEEYTSGDNVVMTGGTSYGARLYELF